MSEDRIARGEAPRPHPNAADGDQANGFLLPRFTGVLGGTRKPALGCLQLLCPSWPKPGSPHDVPQQVTDE